MEYEEIYFLIFVVIEILLLNNILIDILGEDRKCIFVYNG